MNVNELELRDEVLNYTELFKAYELLLRDRDKFFVTDDRLANALCELYAIVGAYQILICMGPRGELKAAPARAEDENQFDICEPLPTHEVVQRAGHELVVAATSGDKATILSALKEMGVFALCPRPEQLFPRMEFITEHVAGHAQQVFLVELSRFAAKACDYQRASQYIERARAFDPSSWELYNICVVEGLIALNDGRIDEAVRCLASSINACNEYEDACLQCCLRAPNLELAEKLLDRGERIAVSRHLLACKTVWGMLQPQIDSWIHVIESGKRPHFLATGNLRVPEKPSYRLRMQWMNACSLAQGPVSPETKRVSPKSPSERSAERERWLAENGPRISAFIKKKLEYLEKDLATPSDQPPSAPPTDDR